MEKFNEFGRILEIVAHDNLRMKGQAFIVYSRLEDAIKAQKVMKNRELFGKPMIIQFAKTRSDAIVLREEGEGGLEKYKAPRKEAWENLQKELKHREDEEKKNGDGVVTSKKKKLAYGTARVSSSVKVSGGIVRKNEPPAPPNKILFLENLPQGIQESRLTEIFSKYAGFIEVRLFAVRKVGFVEYETENQAVAVKKSLDDFELDGMMVKVSYAKK